MGVSNSRAYLRTLALYKARTGVDPVASDLNIIQDIVQAILEEVTDHIKTQTSGTVVFTATQSSSNEAVDNPYKIVDSFGAPVVRTYTATFTTPLGLEQK